MAQVVVEDRSLARANAFRNCPPTARAARSSWYSRSRKDSTVDVEEIAVLTELYRGENTIVDIVAVHGLNGHPFRTWTTKESNKCWLSDAELLPKNVNQARILTFKYNADVSAWFGKTSSNTIMEHAHTLVAELVADRELEGASQRPIIFLCHSLGGIIVKRALAYSASRTSKNIQHLNSIFASTYGILFFGTPHEGASIVGNVASTSRKMLSAMAPTAVWDSEGQLLDALKQGSEVLENVTDMFAPLMKKFRIFFFWEEEKTDIGPTKAYIVERHSAAPILDNTERAGLPKDHRNMCRFESRKSPGYTVVAEAILRYSREAPDVIEPRWKRAAEMLRANRRQEASELLDGIFDDIS